MTGYPTPISCVTSFDAREWAKEFCSYYPEVPEEMVIGWFANALMLGFDEAMMRLANKPASKNETIIACYRDAPK